MICYISYGSYAPKQIPMTYRIESLEPKLYQCSIHFLNNVNNAFPEQNGSNVETAAMSWRHI